MKINLKKMVKDLVRHGTPLTWRKGACVLMERRNWFKPDTRFWWTRELLRDLEANDRDEYHRFLWTHHLGYAHTYEVEKRFGAENMIGSRKLFFSELSNALELMEMPAGSIRSVFEVGCSLGYQLRYLETDLFPDANELVGIDIDSHAVGMGKAFLEKNGSRVKLIREDMAALPLLLAGKRFDIIFCTGVLMYLQEVEAERVVEAIMGHCRIAAFSGLADPRLDNSLLESSGIRESDGTFIHNIDAMVEKASGEVKARRWDGSSTIEGQTIYFVFARPEP